MESIARIGRVAHATLGAQAYEALRDRLIAGALAPGERLSLRTLAEGLGTSVMPAREAVSRLVADEALEVLPNRAVRVPVMTLSTFRELTRVRIAVEGFAATEAARRLAPDDLAAIRSHDAAFRHEVLAPEPDLERAMRANRDLHFAVYRAAGLPSLVAIIEGLWLRIGPVLNLDMRSSRRRVAEGGAQVHHAHLAAALAAGDGDGARAALAADIAASADFIETTGRLAP
ncbi:GntR family transcriptional regulator [Methylobacterium platani]|uniref:GntR family transcriptional regulator n=2 Tax=Methylobacterium platani TaxID=427683 RepID=A0A179SJ90_9HYPH|nr:FCD domain-containing protein [Methylobacterium platani]KMO19707.1 transcriptional regulator [Methylobacterium platani JCM 14648]OAS26634.1 GntR family transcriptional regulator [Methylobacterium platani]